MYVCICQSVSDKHIRQAVDEGVRTFAELQACTSCSTCCGRCEPEARRQLGECLSRLNVELPLAAVA